MNRKERRSCMDDAVTAARAAIRVARGGDTACRMAAIQTSMLMLREAEVPPRWNGVEQLWYDYVYVAKADPDFPPDLLSSLCKAQASVEEAIDTTERHCDRLHQLAEDIVLTREVWDKYTKR